jgi:aspartate/methionine/tyrosine aminotransferase
MAKIATRIAQLTGEGALAVYTRAKELEKQGRSIIHLELGEPDFHPAAPVVDTLRAAVAEGRDRYVSTRGIPPLREAIADYLKRTRKLDVRAEQVLVAPGCKMALALAMMALIEPGDEVLYPDPSFPIYPSFTRGLGAKAVPYALRERNRFQPDVAEIAAKITPKTSMLIFNSPNNPTGTVFSDATLLQIAELARKHDLWVIADEIYARILFSGEYKSIWSLPGMTDRTVIIDGFSKSFAMTGWRLGYAVAQTPVIDALDMLVLNTFTCTAEFTQVAGIEALLDITSAVPAMVHEYRKRRDLFVAKLNKIPGRRLLRLGEHRGNRQNRGRGSEDFAGRGGRGRNCRRGVWSGGQELSALLTGERHASAGRGVGAHSPRVVALARHCGAVSCRAVRRILSF